MTLTEQQERIVKEGISGGSVKAYAGTGKTSTLVELCKHHPGKRFLYLAFNKAMANEAKSKFPINAKVSTIHAFALDAATFERNRLAKTNLRPLDIEEYTKKYNIVGRIALGGLRNFFNDGSKEIDYDHCYQIVAEEAPRTSEKLIVWGHQVAQKIWKDMQDPNGKMPIEHDCYLKMAQLEKNKIAHKIADFDVVLVDEAQDLNGAMVSILQDNKDNTKILAVGDPHQAIYGFRGATNALDLFDGEQFLLSESFRFGSKIAQLSSQLLKRFRDEKDPILGRGPDTRILRGNDRNSQTMKISRTNSELIIQANTAIKENLPFHFMGGVREDIFNAAEGAWGLKTGDKKLAAKNTYSRRYIQEGYAQFEKYAHDTGDVELMTAINLVMSYDVPKLKQDIKENNLPTSEGAIYLFTTAHRAKGLEHDNVELLNDFKTFDPLEEGLNPDSKEYQLKEAGKPPMQEVNLLYVAMTRAKQTFIGNEVIDTWQREEERQRKLIETNPS